MYDKFFDYLKKYNKTDIDSRKEQYYNFDGVVPVLSQSIHHFRIAPVRNVIIRVGGNHILQPAHGEKIYQALAMGGGFR